MLSQCRPGAAAGWARRGLGPVAVALVEGWVVVAPTGPAIARHPYDDAVRSLAGRPVSWTMRPALGVFHVGRQVVVTVHFAQWRDPQRWLIWTPREGRVAPDGLPEASFEDVVDAASGQRRPTGHAARDQVDALAAVFADGTLDARTVLAEFFGILCLPGLDVLTGVTPVVDLPLARRIVPSPRAARAFDRVVGEEARHLDEMEL